MGDEAFDLLAGGFAEGLGAAEIDGVGLDEVGIELVLADQLAEAVADFGTAVVSVFPIDRPGRELLRLPGGRSGFGKRADLLDRANADAVGLAQGPIDRPSLGHPHLGAVDQGRHIGGIRIAVADKSFTYARLENLSSEHPTRPRRIA